MGFFGRILSHCYWILRTRSKN